MLRVKRNDMRKLQRCCDRKNRCQSERTATAITIRMLRVKRNDMRKLQRARRIIAPLSAGFVKAVAKEWTLVLD